MASYLDRVHQNPSPNLLKNIARNSAHENARIAIDKNNNLWAADGSKFLHKDLGNGPDYENIGTHKVVGYVTHHNGDYIVGAWDKGSSMTKPSSHEWLDKLFSHGFQNGTNDKDNFSDFARGGIISAFKADGGIVGDPDTDEGITAYHGSPHDFEQFDMSKIGTGEGNQSYGHGLYFAQNEDVAKGYRDQLSGHHPGDVKIGDETHPHWASRDVINAYRKLGYDNETAVMASHFLNEHKGDLNAAIGNIWDNDKLPNTVIDALFNTEYATPAGHMYEVRINAHPDHFLDWDKPFHEQSEYVKQGLRSIPEFDERVAKYGVLDPDYKSKISMGEFINRGVLPHSYDKSGPEFSNAYHAAGIKGVKYLDQGSRWGDKKNPTSNYVVFDDKLVNVKRKYAAGGSVVE